MQNLFAAVQDNSTTYQRPKLKITDVKSANIQGFHVLIYTIRVCTAMAKALTPSVADPPSFRASVWPWSARAH